MLNIAKSFKSLNAIAYQQIRHIRIRKPPGMPRAKGKRFWIPKEYIQPDDEVKFTEPLIISYKQQMRSMYQLMITEKKFIGQASLKQKLAEEMAYERENALLEMNDQMNLKIRQMQLEDRKIEEQEATIKRQQELEKRRQQEQRLRQIAEQKVVKLKELSKTFIDPNNLEYEIEKMLNERVDYNFSIDTKGNILRASVAQNQKQPEIASS